MLFRKPRTLSGSKFSKQGAADTSTGGRNRAQQHTTAPSDTYAPFLISPIGGKSLPLSRTSNVRMYRTASKGQTTATATINRSLHLQKRKKVEKVNSTSTNPIVVSGGTDLRRPSSMSVTQVVTGAGGGVADPTRANTTQLSDPDNVLSLPASALHNHRLMPAMNLNP